MKTTKDRTGERFGRLLVIKHYKGARYWRVVCLCDCGKEINRQASNVLSSLTRSCGCLRREIMRNIKFKHGALRNDQKRWPEYHIWHGMKVRCYNKNSNAYKNYGGRGIQVCDRWRYSFANFLEDMGRRPHPKLTIERINNNGDYGPINCHWATRTHQARNKRTSKRLTINGETLTVLEWAQRAGIKYHTLRARLRYGWNPQDAVLLPLKQ